MTFFRDFFYRLSGGRPMEMVRANLFTDVVANAPVHVWRDGFNRFWIATDKWSLFRVEIREGEW